MAAASNTMPWSSPPRRGRRPTCCAPCPALTRWRPSSTPLPTSRYRRSTCNTTPRCLFPWDPISTFSLKYAPALRLPLPFCALLDEPEHGIWGQFVFDRGQLDQGQDGLLAVVISGASAAAALERDVLAANVAAQL